MRKSSPQLDVLILGSHPCAYLAGTILKQAGSVRVLHSAIPGEVVPSRVTLINPELFDLHPIFGSLKRKLDLAPVYGVKFLSDDAAISSMQAGKTISAYVTGLKPFQAAMAKVAREADLESRDPSELQIVRLDEAGIEVRLDGTTVNPKLMIVAGELPSDQKKLIGLSPKWDVEVMHRYTFLCLKGTKWHDPGSRPILPMSLDLSGTLHWAWLLATQTGIQLALEQPLKTVQQNPPEKLLRDWIRVLDAHGILKPGAADGIDASNATSIDLPLAGALAQEGVANRTLLIGPAGGFYTACAEDIYPNCWSAIHACDVARKALKEPHLQDAIQAYRQKWGATLGDYLRGPQQNLRFLLPLVYRNPTMAARLSEAIFSGKSVVR